MPESKTISLVIPPEPTSTSHTLESQIQQIISQKGHFRHVTERSLLADIHGKTSALDSTRPGLEEASQGTEDDTPQKRTELLWDRRKQMLERLGAAQNDVLCALDLVSWLISQQSVPARHSMSGPLKEAAPVGSLAARVLEETPISMPVRRQLVSVSQGWRSESFRSSSDRLGEASARLEIQAEHESKFWHLIAELRAKGWPISRLPRDRKAIGVHFGFTDAAPQFRDRGFALLLQAADGSVELDKRSLPKKRKRLAVHVVRDNVKTGVFHFTDLSTTGEQDVSQQLTESRDLLFEEELFYETCREARFVANQGITTSADTVEVAVGDYQLLLTSSDEQEESPSTNDEDNLLAGFVAISLRLLLNAAHEQNLNRRSQKAPPLTMKSRTTPEYALIRPILTHLRHRAEARALWTSCQTLLLPFQKASVPVRISMEKSAVTVFESLKISPPDTILSMLMMPARVGYEMSLPNAQSLQIGLATFLGPPLLGSRYEISRIHFGFSDQAVSRHETQEAAIACIRHMLLLGLVAHAEALTKSPHAKMEPSKQKPWNVSQPHSGELTMYDSQEAVYKLRVSVSMGFISIKFSSSRKGTAANGILWTWSSVGCVRAEGDAATKEEDVTFDEIVRQVLASTL